MSKCNLVIMGTKAGLQEVKTGIFIKLFAINRRFQERVLHYISVKNVEILNKDTFTWLN